MTELTDNLCEDEFAWPPGEYLPTGPALQLLAELERRWEAQTALLPRQPDLSVGDEADDTAVRLRDDLTAMAQWFDPTATGSRLRQALESLPEEPESDCVAPPQLVLPVRSRAALVTPEGRAFLWCLRRADAAGAFRDADAYVRLDPADSRAATASLVRQYAAWGTRRLVGVAALLADETATLRPTAAGLLLVLLVNRNTAEERSLPRPKDRTRRSAISAAVAAPALAYAHALAARKDAKSSGLDLYQGWALGELARRLGSGLVTDNGIYIRPEAEDRAIERLVADLARRDNATRSRVPNALDAALDAYENSRPVLHGLGLSHERTEHTRALQARLLRAALPSAGPA